MMYPNPETWQRYPWPDLVDPEGDIDYRTFQQNMPLLPDRAPNPSIAGETIILGVDLIQKWLAPLQQYNQEMFQTIMAQHGNLGLWIVVTPITVGQIDIKPIETSALATTNVRIQNVWDIRGVAVVGDVGQAFIMGDGNVCWLEWDEEMTCKVISAAAEGLANTVRESDYAGNLRTGTSNFTAYNCGPDTPTNGDVVKVSRDSSGNWCFFF